MQTQCASLKSISQLVSSFQQLWNTLLLLRVSGHTPGRRCEHAARRRQGALSLARALSFALTTRPLRHNIFSEDSWRMEMAGLCQKNGTALAAYLYTTCPNFFFLKKSKSGQNIPFLEPYFSLKGICID